MVVEQIDRVSLDEAPAEAARELPSMTAETEPPVDVAGNMIPKWPALVSDTLNLVPNSFALPAELLATMDAQRLSDAQRAYAIFQSPFNFYSDNNRRQPKGDISYEDNNFRAYAALPSPAKAATEIGEERLVKGFKDFLTLSGERSFDGLEPKIIHSDERTTLDEYLKLVSVGELPLSDWQRHDVHFHLLGALLATAGVTERLKLAAVAASTLSRKDQEDVAKNIDTITYRITALVRKPNNAVGSLNDMTQRLTELAGLTGDTSFTAEMAQGLAREQASRIIQLRDHQPRPFVHPHAIEYANQKAEETEQRQFNLEIAQRTAEMTAAIQPERPVITPREYRFLGRLIKRLF